MQRSKDVIFYAAVMNITLEHAAGWPDFQLTAVTLLILCGANHNKLSNTNLCGAKSMQSIVSKLYITVSLSLKITLQDYHEVLDGRNTVHQPLKIIIFFLFLL